MKCYKSLSIWPNRDKMLYPPIIFWGKSQSRWSSPLFCELVLFPPPGSLFCELVNFWGYNMGQSLLFFLVTVGTLALEWWPFNLFLSFYHCQPTGRQSKKWPLSTFETLTLHATQWSRKLGSKLDFTKSDWRNAKFHQKFTTTHYFAMQTPSWHY